MIFSLYTQFSKELAQGTVTFISLQLFKLKFSLEY